MNSRLTSIIKWGCIVYAAILLPKLFVGEDAQEEAPKQKPLRVGIVTENKSLSLSQQSVLAELGKQGYTVDKLLVVDRACEHAQQYEDETIEPKQLELLIADADLEGIDVLLCEG